MSFLVKLLTGANMLVNTVYVALIMAMILIVGVAKCLSVRLSVRHTPVLYQNG